MLSREVVRFKPVEVGNTVTMPISELDRGLCDMQNAIALVLEKIDSLFNSGHHSMLLPQFYSRNQINSTTHAFLIHTRVYLLSHLFTLAFPTRSSISLSGSSLSPGLFMSNHKNKTTSSDSQLKRSESDAEFKSVGLLLRRSFGSKEKAWRKALFDHHKSTNPANKCKINLNVLKCISGDFYYDPFENNGNMVNHFQFCAHPNFSAKISRIFYIFAGKLYILF